jgi:hypothetical protein
MYNELQNKKFLHSAHTVYLSFVWISEQTKIISLYSINRLVLKNDIPLCC